MCVHKVVQTKSLNEPNEISYTHDKRFDAYQPVHNFIIDYQTEESSQLSQWVPGGI